MDIFLTALWNVWKRTTGVVFTLGDNWTSKFQSFQPAIGIGYLLYITVLGLLFPILLKPEVNHLHCFWLFLFVPVLLVSQFLALFPNTYEIGGCVGIGSILNAGLAITFTLNGILHWSMIVILVVSPFVTMGLGYLACLFMRTLIDEYKKLRSSVPTVAPKFNKTDF
jgi:hypothetical protein